MATIILALFAGSQFRWENVAFSYAVTTPLPGVGLPSVIALRAEDLQYFNWHAVLRNPEVLLVAWPVVFMLLTLVLLVQFVVVLVRVRRLRDELPAYCREV